MPRFPGEKYQLDQPLYDTVQLAAVATQTVNFFINPLGSIIAGAVAKTYTHTNMVQAGTLEKGTTFTVTGYSFYMRELATGGVAPTLADARAITIGNVNFQLGQVSFYRSPTAQIPGGGAELYLNDTATVHVGRGVPAWQNRIHLAHPIPIDEQEAIQVTAVIESTVAAVTDITFVLWGTQLRPVR